MKKPDISPNFTLDDIHKIRGYNHEMTKNMTTDEMRMYYKKGADTLQLQIDAIKKAKKASQSNLNRV